jgi:hypothetical protein
MSVVTDEIAQIRQRGRGEPIGGYLALFSVFATGAGAAAWLLRDRIRRSDVRAGDIVLIGAATHKLARIISKDVVMIPLRSPFVGSRKHVGNGEVEEDARGKGLRLAIGKLVTCPYCLAPWVAAGLSAGLVARPKYFRLLASVFTAVGIADMLQLIYGKLKDLDLSR